MTVLMFYDRFVSKVENGTKRHTIRAPRKSGKQIEPGDTLSLRQWSAKPYRSKQRVIKEVECVRVSAFYMDEAGRMAVNLEWLDYDQRQRLAVADGFDDLEEMIAWNREKKRLPMDGFLIEWNR